MAHPDLVAIAEEVFNLLMPNKNQINKKLDSFSVSSTDLTAIPEGTRTEHGFRHNISVTLGTLAFIDNSFMIQFWRLVVSSFAFFKPLIFHINSTWINILSVFSFQIDPLLFFSKN